MTPRPGPRAANCTPAQARDRLKAAKAYLDLADLASLESDLTSHQRAALVGNAVLAGIAACDAICGLAIGQYSRGQDHSQAVGMLQRVKVKNPSLTTRFARLLALKSNAHYSAGTISAQQAEQALRTARDMITEADTITG